MTLTAQQVANSNEMVRHQPQIFSLRPSTLAEAMEYAKIMASSRLVPKDYQGNPADILVAVQLGAELGPAPIQALQNIAVISGRPCV